MHQVPNKSLALMELYAFALERSGLHNEAAAAHREILRWGLLLDGRGGGF